ncbi:MAG: DUF3025 domain-containing protein [Betaproteobacteria bacterium]|nr:DUF3025 domain-containing protein [Betaproteobacteria bacterium]
MADYWNTDWLNRSDMFAPLRAVGARLPGIGWPNPDLLTALADDAGRVVNAQGLRVRFVPQAPKSKHFRDGFEPRVFLKGEVQIRPLDWHDLFNALVWMTFPTTKAVINARHYELLSAGESGNRPAVCDALTLFDEDGLVVLCSDSGLLDLVREFRWKELFWNRREQVRKRMRFLLFGHALYHKALNPFVGMTGKGVLFEVPDAFAELPLNSQIAEADRLLAAHVWDRKRMSHGREFSPLPVLGVAGWWGGNEEESFYENTEYFRPGRGSPGERDQAATSSV